MDNNATQLQLLRGDSASNDAYTGRAGELTVNTTDWSIRVHDGVTVGGYVISGTGGGTTLSSSYAQSASVALTASYALNVKDVFPYTGSAIVSGSLTVTGSINAPRLTGSLLGTSSWAQSASVAISSSYSISSSFTISALSSSFARTASFTTSASYALSSSFTTSGSYALSSSFATSASRASSSATVDVLSGGSTTGLGIYSGSFFGTASSAVTASFALNATPGFPFSGSAVITGSLIISSSGLYLSGSGVTGSLLGTSSWAVSASRATTASFSISSSYSLSSSFAVTSSYALTASRAISASRADLAGQVDVISGGSTTGLGIYSGSFFGTSSWANTASFALNAASGAGFPFSGSAVITGSLLISGSGIQLVGAGLTGSISGSLIGTASFATTASFAPVGPGTVNSIALFNTTNTVSSSNIFQSSNNILIGNVTDVQGRLAILSGSIALDNNQGIRFRDTAGTVESALNITTANNVQLNAPTLGGNIQYSIRNATGAHQFLANATESVRITNAGNVGIGVSTPSYKLHISGANNTSPLGITFPLATYQFSANSTSGYVTSINMTDTGLTIGHNSSLRNLQLLTNSTARLTILGDGNVGIGTTAPVATLQIQGNVSGSSFTSSINNAVGFFGTASWAVSSSRAFSSEKIDVISGGSTTGLGIYSGSFFGTASQAITASYALNAGSATAGFPFSGSAVITGSLIISGSGLTLIGAGLTGSISGSLTGTASFATSASFAPVGPGTSQSIALFNSSNTISSSIIFQSGSNIGIGTTTPAGRLTVSGTTTGSLLINTNNPNDNTQPYSMVLGLPQNSPFIGGGFMISNNQAEDGTKAFLSVVNSNLTNGTNTKTAGYFFTNASASSHATRQAANGNLVVMTSPRGSNLTLTNQNLYFNHQDANSTSGDYVNSQAYLYAQFNTITTRVNQYTAYLSRGQIATSGPTLATITDFQAGPYIGIANGTITTRYGLLIDFTTASITNAYGVFQSQTGLINHFAGTVGIGTTSPDASLTVFNQASFNTGSLTNPGIASRGDLNTGIYFPSPDTIGFVEGGVEVIRIDSSGNVGISTTNPGTNKLQVQGNISASSYTSSINNAVGFFGTSSWSVSSSRTVSASRADSSALVDVLSGGSTTGLGIYSGSFSGSFFGTLSGSGGGSGVGFPFSGSAVITGSLLISGSGLRLVGGGLTGSVSGSLIGTASFATTASFALSSSFTTTASFSITSSFASSASFAPVGPGTLQSIALFNSSNTVSSSVIFQSGSNIGIGTTTPTARLTVNGGATISGSSTIIGNLTVGQNSNASTVARIDLTAGGNGFDSLIDFGYYDTFDANIWNVGRKGSTGAFFISNQGSGAEVNAITITGATNNVGIGISSSINSKLQIQGNVSASSYTSSINNAVGFLGTASWAQSASRATSVAPDSVTLGTDTTGNYAGTVTQGKGITVSGTAGEGTTYTVTLGSSSAGYNISGSGNWFTVARRTNASTGRGISEVYIHGIGGDAIPSVLKVLWNVDWSGNGTVRINSYTGNLNISNIRSTYTGSTGVSELEIQSTTNSNHTIYSTVTDFSVVSGNITPIVTASANLPTTTTVPVGYFYDGAIFSNTSANVGIGTTNPGFALDISGSTGVRARILAAAQGTPGLVLSSAGATAYTIKAGNGDSSLRIDQDGSDRITLATGGNVGIGTTNPTVALQVSKTDSGIIVNAGSSAVTGSGIKFRNDGYDHWTAGVIGTAFSIATSGDNGDRIWGNSPNRRLTITSTGLVGIGTTSPTNTLQIQGNVSASSYTSSISNAVGFFGTSSWAVSSSRTVSASRADSSEKVDVLSGGSTTGLGIYSGSFSGSFFGTLSGSGGGSGVGFPFSGSAVITGSLLISGSGLNLVGGGISASSIVVSSSLGQLFTTSSASLAGSISSSFTDTGLFANQIGNHAAYEMYLAWNPNRQGHPNYRHVVVGDIIVMTNWNGTDVTSYIGYNERYALSSGSITVRTGSVDVLWVSSSGEERRDCPVNSSTNQIRIKYDGFTLNNPEQNLRLTRKL